jgi:hypothetical protein
MFVYFVLVVVVKVLRSLVHCGWWWVSTLTDCIVVVFVIAFAEKTSCRKKQLRPKKDVV